MNKLQTCQTCDAQFDSQDGAMCPKCLLRGVQPSSNQGRAAAVNFNATQTYDQGQPIADSVSAERLQSLFPELEVLEVIGHGGMGVVYKARQKNLGREVALKLLSSNLLDDPSFAERFTREARAMAMMNHPNIISIFDFGQRGEHYFLVMEYVDGLNLRQLIQGTKLEPTEAMQLIPQLCDALQYAHDRGIVHRDIKPENVLISQEGFVKIADFGLAKLTGSTANNLTLTQSRQVMGTLNYMAPEQVEHPTDVDHRADIYSLGVVIYELLTGELPLGRFSAPSEKVEIDVRLDEVVLRALEKDPSLRYQQASEFKTGLQRVSGTDLANVESPIPIKKPLDEPVINSPADLLTPMMRFTWLATGTSLFVLGFLVYGLGVSIQEATVEFVGNSISIIGGLVLIVYGIYVWVFGDQSAKLRTARDEARQSTLAKILLRLAIAVMVGAVLAHKLFGLDGDIGAVGFIIGLIVLVFRTLFVSRSKAVKVADSNPPQATAKIPIPNWLIALKLLATACFFLCPLCFIGRGFIENGVLQKLLPFMGIALPIVGAFIAAAVQMIISSKGYHDPDDDDHH